MAPRTSLSFAGFSIVMIKLAKKFQSLLWDDFSYNFLDQIIHEIEKKGLHYILKLHNNLSDIN